MEDRSKFPIVIAVVLGLLILVATQTFFRVDQTQKAVLLQLGKPVSEDALGPGLHLKIPFIQNVVYFDTRVLTFDAQPEEILTKDKKNLVVDNYTKFRIVNPLVFYRTLRTIPRAQARLDDIVYSELRVALGHYDLIEIVAQDRARIMKQVTEKSNELIADYGIEVIDVRIKRTDLPPENERAIFGRMRAERERQAKQYRSEGQEEAAKIRAKADKERTIIIAEANRQAEELRGQGDAEATRIYAEAYTKAPDFFQFLRSMDAYKRSFEGRTDIILTPESQYLRYMR